MASITLKPHNVSRSAAASPTFEPLKATTADAAVSIAAANKASGGAESTAGSSPIHAFRAPEATLDTSWNAAAASGPPEASSPHVRGVPVAAAWAQQPALPPAQPRAGPAPLLRVSAAGAPGTPFAPPVAAGDGHVAAKSYVVHADRPLVRTATPLRLAACAWSRHHRTCLPA